MLRFFLLLFFIPVFFPFSIKRAEAATCAKIISVGYQPARALKAGENFTCNAVIDRSFSGSRNIACGWRKNGSWPENGGRWEGATCNGTNCTFGIRMDGQTSPGATYTLVAFDFVTPGCGPDHPDAKSIPLPADTGAIATPVAPTSPPVQPSATSVPGQPTVPPVVPSATLRPGQPTTVPSATPLAGLPTAVPSLTSKPGQPTPTQKPVSGSGYCGSLPPGYCSPVGVPNLPDDIWYCSGGRWVHDPGHSVCSSNDVRQCIGKGYSPTDKISCCDDRGNFNPATKCGPQKGTSPTPTIDPVACIGGPVTCSREAWQKVINCKNPGNPLVRRFIEYCGKDRYNNYIPGIGTCTYDPNADPIAGQSCTNVPKIDFNCTASGIADITGLCKTYEKGGRCVCGHDYCSPASLRNYLDMDTKAVKASIICTSESNSRPDAINNNCSTGDYSVGLFQINLYWHCAKAQPDHKTCTFGNIAERDKCIARFVNPVENMRYMAYISGGGSDWWPWKGSRTNCQIENGNNYNIR